MKAALTDWFPPQLPPVRPGMYIVRDGCSDGCDGLLMLWDGAAWRWPDGSLFATEWRWRGLAFDPNSKPVNKIDIVVSFDVKGRTLHSECNTFHVHDGDTINIKVPLSA